jgi:2-keto-3-deoxy-L-rhamnonate aldolase RhmA/pimeloyl-ACP methyl ester carboxylesterase
VVVGQGAVRVEQIAGVEVALECIGEGSPCLIFVHGFGCGQEDWRRQVEALAPRFRCVTFDLPGHGRSGLPPSGDVQQLGRTLCEVIERHGHDRVVLVGHSLGCRVILNAMCLCPRGVMGLILIEQNLVAGGAAEAAANALRSAVAESGFATFIRPAFAAMFSADSEPGLRERALARLDYLDPRFGAELLVNAVLWEQETPGQLARLRVPVLLLQSTRLDGEFKWHRLEPGMSTPWTETVARWVPDSKLEVIPGSGHFLQLEAAAAVNAHIAAFAERWQVTTTIARGGTSHYGEVTAGPRQPEVSGTSRPSALARLRLGEAVFGALQSIPTPVVTEIAVWSGYDFVILDCEHAIVDETAHLAALQVIAGSDAFAVVRVRPGDLSAVGRYLDIGADGILLPDVRSAAEAQAFVAAAFPAPAGTRSSTGGSARATRYRLVSSEPRARPLLLAMIEGAQAVSAISAIAATPGLDGLVIGPYDLAADLGAPEDFSTPAYREAFAEVARAAVRAGILLGSRSHPGFPIERLLDAGHRFILLSSDAAALRDGYRAHLEAVRRGE